MARSFLKPIIQSMQRNIVVLDTNLSVTNQQLGDTNLNLLMEGTSATKNQTAINKSINSILAVMLSGGVSPTITTGRTLNFINGTAANPLDLYLTAGGSYAASMTLLSTLDVGGTYSWDIPPLYNWSGNFTTMPAGIPPPQYNAGPTLFEIGTNQIWSGATPDLRDTFDISTVPPGIGASLNNGPRSAVVAASLAAGFSQQQAYGYNVGIEVIPPVGITLSTQTVTCDSSNGDSPNSIGYPNDTARPKQQTGDALGSYQITFIDPVVSL